MRSGWDRAPTDGPTSRRVDRRYVIRHVPAVAVLLCATTLHAAVLERVDTVGTSVRLHVSAPVAPQAHQQRTRVGQPDQLVVDLPGTTLGVGARGVVSGRGPLLRARTEQLDGVIVRVTLDLDDSTTFAMTNDDAVITITLETPSAAPRTPPTIPRVRVPGVGAR